MAIDYIDLDKGRMGGYWAQERMGTGGGRGTGYAIMQFPAAMPKGEKLAQDGPLRSKGTNMIRWRHAVVFVAVVLAASVPPARRSSPR